MSIQQNLKTIKDTLPKEVTLVAVSKTKPVSDIMQAYQAGHRVFGENKIQDMADKHAIMPKDIAWHMIGHVQRNKVKYMASFVSLIHGVDSLKLLEEINKQAQKHNRVINCLLQIKIATEDTKFGMPPEEVLNIINTEAFSQLKNINITGLMGMASFTTNTTQVTAEFKKLEHTFNNLKSNKLPNFNIKIISMGMSADYKLAIACGSNMIRVGSSIFGARH